MARSTNTPHPVSGGLCTFAGGASGGDIYTANEGAPTPFDYVTYGLLLESNKLTWYVNGIKSNSYTTNTAASAADEMWIILNLALGGHWPGNPDGTTPWSGNMLIDYVKVWQPGAPTHARGPKPTGVWPAGTVEVSLVNLQGSAMGSLRSQPVRMWRLPAGVYVAYPTAGQAVPRQAVLMARPLLVPGDDTK